MDLDLQHYPQCCLPEEKENRGVWGETWSGAYREPGHEDHVPLLWESGGNGRGQLPALASLQPSGATQLSWPICEVLSWQSRSWSLGLLAGPPRSASCSRSPRPSKTKWRQTISAPPSGSEAVWPSGSQDASTFCARTSVSSTCSTVSCVHGGFRTAGSVVSCSLRLSILKGSLLPHLPASPALLPIKFTKILKVSSSRFCDPLSAQYLMPLLPPDYFIAVLLVSSW